MVNRKNVHIVQSGVKWGALREGGEHASGLYDSQTEAIDAGRVMARSGKGELLIHGRNELIRARDSYGNDPCPPKDKS